MSLKEKFLKIESVTLGIIRRWWRPITCVWIAGTMAVHGVILPLAGRSTDLTGLSLLVTAIAGAFAVREWGKIKGVDDGN